MAKGQVLKFFWSGTEKELNQSGVRIPEVVCSVDISTCEEDADYRCFGAEVDINSVPTDEGFGSDEFQLLFTGYLNYKEVQD